MSIKIYKAYTSSIRHRVTLDYSNLSRIRPNKQLTSYYHRSQGRNNQGRITCRHRGGGHKRLYRKIDFKRNKICVAGTVTSIEYDPNRTANIALVNYTDGENRYILHAEGLQIGDIITQHSNTEIKQGNATHLKNMPLGTFVHNVEAFPGKGGQYIRSAGSFATIIAKRQNQVGLLFPSKCVCYFNNLCFATIGKVGNSDNKNIKLGKAGAARWKGLRPEVRGSAMNPVDHPHGGGEGRCPIGKKRPVTPWGKPTLGLKTRNISKPLLKSFARAK